MIQLELKAYSFKKSVQKISRGKVGKRRLNQIIKVLPFLFQKTEQEKVITKLVQIHSDRFILNLIHPECRFLEVQKLFELVKNLWPKQKVFYLDDYVTFMNPFQSVQAGVVSIMTYGHVAGSRTHHSETKNRVELLLKKKGVDTSVSASEFPRNEFYQLAAEIAVEAGYDLLITSIGLNLAHSNEFFKKRKFSVIEIVYD